MVLVVGACAYFLWKLIDLLIAAGVLLAGAYLVGRSLRQSQRSS